MKSAAESQRTLFGSLDTVSKFMELEEGSVMRWPSITDRPVHAEPILPISIMPLKNGQQESFGLKKRYWGSRIGFCHCCEKRLSLIQGSLLCSKCSKPETNILKCHGILGLHWKK